MRAFTLDAFLPPELPMTLDADSAAKAVDMLDLLFEFFEGAAPQDL
jgi:hypothetical protein